MRVFFMIKYFLESFCKCRMRQDERGNLWYQASDVCQVLKMTNPAMTVFIYLDATNRKKFGKSGSKNDPWFIDESGIFLLMLRSNCDLSKAFRKWVVRELISNETIGAIPKSPGIM